MTLNASDPAFFSQLIKLFGSDLVRLTEPGHMTEPRGRYIGQAGVLALPRNTEQVAQFIGQAARMRVPVIPYGGGTGLVGGQVTPDGPPPLVLSLERMSRIRAVYPDENVIVAEAGTVLADVQSAAKKADRLFPLSLAAEGTARIGGNLATNAGGTGVLRYGNARDLCLGLEAVLPNGEIWRGLSRLRKDNTGYDLRNLLIGSEGTLGVITAAALKLYARPRSVATAMLIVDSPASALQLLGLARADLGEMVSAFELIHRQGLDFLTEVLPQVRQPFARPPEWCVLIEIGLPGEMNAPAHLEALFTAALAAGLASDGVIAQNETQQKAFWSVRENIPEANRRIGSVSSHDISLPIGALPDFITKAGNMINALGGFRINCFGHVGDGNLHYNVFPPQGCCKADYPDEPARIKRLVHDLVDQFGGSVSAEHGIGRFKVEDLERYGDPTKLAAMRAIKRALDPLGIMNPGAVLRG